MRRKVDWRGLSFEIELLDIQELNNRLFDQRFDVAKTSFHAALKLTDQTIVLPSGSALGFGVGPLLLCAEPDATPTEDSQVVLCPGELTTATLLFRLFYPNSARIEHCVFSAIMPRLQEKSADFGVCIHEGRFTYQKEGLGLVEDLGTRWESETECPLPLGGLVASRRLDDLTIAKVQAAVRESLEYAFDNPDEALVSMRRYAQEFDDRVLMQHVELYVNDWTLDLGEVGRGALRELQNRALSLGLADSAAKPIEVWGS